LSVGGFSFLLCSLLCTSPGHRRFRSASAITGNLADVSPVAPALPVARFPLLPFFSLTSPLLSEIAAASSSSSSATAPWFLPSPLTPLHPFRSATPCFSRFLPVLAPSLSHSVSVPTLCVRLPNHRYDSPLVSVAAPASLSLEFPFGWLVRSLVGACVTCVSYRLGSFSRSVVAAVPVRPLHHLSFQWES